jgi:hypothetical protein
MSATNSNPSPALLWLLPPLLAAGVVLWRPSLLDAFIVLSMEAAAGFASCF